MFGFLLIIRTSGNVDSSAYTSIRLAVRNVTSWSSDLHLIANQQLHSPMKKANPLAFSIAWPCSAMKLVVPQVFGLALERMAAVWSTLIAWNSANACCGFSLSINCLIFGEACRVECDCVTAHTILFRYADGENDAKQRSEGRSLLMILGFSNHQIL